MIDAVLTAAASAATSCSDKLCSLGRAEKHFPVPAVADPLSSAPETLCDILTQATSRRVLRQKHQQMLQWYALSSVQAWLAHSTDRCIWHVAADYMAHWLHQQ